MSYDFFGGNKKWIFFEVVFIEILIASKAVNKIIDSIEKRTTKNVW